MDKQQLLNLVEQMTISEKVGQLTQVIAPLLDKGNHEQAVTGPFAELDVAKIDMSKAGSVLGSAGAKELKEIQRKYIEQNRLGIPLLFMADIVHGYKTVFPVPLALSCSWDLELAEKTASVAAAESSAAGLHITFSPMVDLVRDPRWGRVMESTGEDPFLNSEYARAFVRGYQGDDLTNNISKMAACVKHFAAYGAPEGGRDYNTVNMSERQLRESYLPAYKAALDEGCKMVMTAFNTVDGIPATVNETLMRDLLRKEWGFQGVLISDWGAVQEAIPHGVAENEKEAAYKAIKAGLDIEMMTACYTNSLEQLINEGVLEENIVDEAVLRVLELKQELGLFDNPYRGADEEKEKEIILSEEHRRVAKESAIKSCVLLKNDSVLPLQARTNISLIGPFAMSKDVLGEWTIYGEKEHAISLYEGLEKKWGDSVIQVAQGCDVETITETQLEEAIAVAKQSDVIVLALGEHSEMSGEAASRADIRLPKAQLQLVSYLKKLKKPLIVVLFNGRPLDLHGIIDEADAVLEAWYPGTEAGNAIADILTGVENPSGRLTMSFPYSVGQIPVYYNSYRTGRPVDGDGIVGKFSSKYLDIPNEPLFPFGYGLSYTSFEYSEPTVSNNTLLKEGTIIVEVEVSNTGDCSGEEVVQLYVQDVVGEVVRPVKELKGFKKIFLTPGEMKKVQFEISETQFRYYHSDLQLKSDNGEFIIYIGRNSVECQPVSIHLVNEHTKSNAYI
jgi:beta-glucosidase